MNTATVYQKATLMQAALLVGLDGVREHVLDEIVSRFVDLYRGAPDFELSVYDHRHVIGSYLAGIEIFEATDVPIDDAPSMPGSSVMAETVIVRSRR